MENKSTLSTEKNNLMNALRDSDYMVIKCTEASLLGEPAPYDVADLHAKRQAARNRINEIEAAIAAIEAEELAADDTEITE